MKWIVWWTAVAPATDLTEDVRRWATDDVQRVATARRQPASEKSFCVRHAGWNTTTFGMITISEHGFEGSTCSTEEELARRGTPPTRVMLIVFRLTEAKTGCENELDRAIDQSCRCRAARPRTP
jgi:hypothetical protein